MSFAATAAAARARAHAWVTAVSVLVLASIAVACPTSAAEQRAVAQSALACPVIPGGTDYSYQDLTNHNFHAYPPGSLIGANFSHANLSGAVFAGQDLTNANFEGANLGPSLAPVDFTSAKVMNTCFIGASVDQTDFSYAVITCADFSNTSLMNANFGYSQNIQAGTGCRTKFVGATLDVHAISTAHWGKTDFTNANFQNLSPGTFDLIGKNVTGAILAGTSFIGIDMTGANLTGVDFSGAKLNNAVLHHATLNGAKLANAQAPYASFVCARAYGTAGDKDRTLPDGNSCPPAPSSSDPQTGADFTFAGLKNADFTAATLDHAIMTGANLNAATFTNASLVQANLISTSGITSPAIVQFATFINTDFSNATLSGVNFSGGKLDGAIFANTTLNNNNFAYAQMPEAKFSSASLQSVDFTLAQLQAADFSNAIIQASGTGSGQATNFYCSQLGGSNFNNTKVAAANFANAVMPDKTDCCPATTTTGTAWCGEYATGNKTKTYGGVTFPLLNAPVTCPNGDTGLCAASQWRLSPTWTTTGCNVNRTSEQMWAQPDCAAGPVVDVVTFADPNLEKCILAMLPGQTKVPLKTAQQMTQVNCPGRGISTLAGLEAFTSLTKLDLNGNALLEFSLSLMSSDKKVAGNLQTLDVSNNQLKTLDLQWQPKLVSLDASNNQLTSINLSANAYLVVLNASHNSIAIFDLAIQSALSYVDLSYNNLTTVDVFDQLHPNLSGLQALAYLDLSHNLLVTIGSVQSLATDKSNTLTGGGPLQALFLACNANFRCADLGIIDGYRYPAAATSMCSDFNAAATTQQKWTVRTTPACPPGLITTAE